MLMLVDAALRTAFLGAGNFPRLPLSQETPRIILTDLPALEKRGLIPPLPARPGPTAQAWRGLHLRAYQHPAEPYDH
jgi:hypothetical protein